MRVHDIIERLRANVDVFDALTRGVSEEQARWKPTTDEWSILEVVNHLADEEVEDFRHRFDHPLLGLDLGRKANIHSRLQVVRFFFSNHFDHRYRDATVTNAILGSIGADQSQHELIFFYPNRDPLGRDTCHDSFDLYRFQLRQARSFTTGYTYSQADQQESSKLFLDHE